MVDSQRKSYNLFNKDNADIRQCYVWNDRNYVATSQNTRSVILACKPNTTYTVSKTLSNRFALAYTNTNPTLSDDTPAYGIVVDNDAKSLTITTGGSAQYLVIFFIYIPAETKTVEEIVATIMVNEGQTAKPYEAYGWLHSLRKLTTATDTLTTLPADVYADGNNATVGLEGNMSQTGTPTPSSPIQPQECGDRTGNLFDKSQPSTVGFVREDGTINDNNNYRISDYIQLLPNTQYTVSNMNVNGLYPAVCFYTDNKTYISGSKYDGATVFTFTTPSNCKYVLVSYLLSLVNNVMLNTGSTALPYEPYGIKIPISSANTTTPVYLGEVETTRKIKKLVLTGEETWSLHSSFANLFVLSGVTDYKKMTYNVSQCSHYKGTNSALGAAEVTDKQAAFYYNPSSPTSSAFYIKDTTFSTATDFKTYLQQQYAAGTPVTVWYVLATPTTGIVNEPLRKIGNYADTVSGITIPTITGKDTFDVETTLKPSEVSLAYTGWHDASVKEKSENFAYDILVQDLQPLYSIVLLFSADLEPDTTYTLSFDSISGFYFYINETVFDVKYITTVTGRNQVICTTKSTLNKSDNRQYLNGRWIILKNAMNQPTNIDITNVMFNSGQTALPYAPYWK